MRGKYNIIIANNKVEFNLVVDRKVTIVKGDSGTGKTTLYRIITTRSLFLWLCLLCSRNSTLIPPF